MEINIAKGIGFCYGVKRALELAKKSAIENGGISCLGHLIHNDKVIKELEKDGVYTVKSIDEIKTERVIIRTHGLPPNVIEEIKSKGKKIIDGTCPYVKRAQNIAKNLMEEGYELIIIGDPSHPEIIGIQGHLNQKGIIVSKEKDVESLPLKRKRAIIAQTTQDVELFKKIVALVALRTHELRVFNTICSYTIKRQKEVEEIAKNVDVMLIIGSMKSSNTTKLFEIAKKILPNSYHIESYEDLSPEMFVGAKRVGIISGSSTPESEINLVAKRILENRFSKKGELYDGKKGL